MHTPGRGTSQQEICPCCKRPGVCFALWLPDGCLVVNKGELTEGLSPGLEVNVR